MRTRAKFPTREQPVVGCMRCRQPLPTWKPEPARIMPDFLRPIAFATAVLLATAASAQSKIGLAAPFEGPLAPLGQQMRDGAQLAATAAGATLIQVDDRCSPEGGAAAARKLVAERVSVVVGFLCTEAIEAALPILAKEGIATITSGVRADWLTERREKTGWLVWRIAPRADAEADAAAQILTRRWRDALFAIVDDGTIYGRDLSETLRLAVEIGGLKPVFIDTFRPQSENQIALVGRLRRAGAARIFVGGDRDDIAIIARDAASLDDDLTIVGGEALRASGEIPIEPGVMMVGIPEPAEKASPQVLQRFADQGIQPEGYALPTHAAVEIALEALQRANASSQPLPGILSGGTFTTSIGPVTFDDKGDLAENPYRLLRYDGTRFLPVE